MIAKLSLLAASLVAALVLAAGLALAGFGTPAPAADLQLVNRSVVPADVATPAEAQAPVQVDTIYLAPQPTPEEITITQVKEAKVRTESEHEGDEHDEGEDD